MNHVLSYFELKRRTILLRYLARRDVVLNLAIYIVRSSSITISLTTLLVRVSGSPYHVLKLPDLRFGWRNKCVKMTGQ